MEQFILWILSKLNKIRYFILKWVIHSFAMMIVKLTLSNIKRLKINVRLLLDINFETLDILSRLNKRGLTFFAFQIWLINQVGYHNDLFKRAKTQIWKSINLLKPSWTDDCKWNIVGISTNTSIDFSRDSVVTLVRKY